MGGTPLAHRHPATIDKISPAGSTNRVDRRQGSAQRRGIPSLAQHRQPEPIFTWRDRQGWIKTLTERRPLRRRLLSPTGSAGISARLQKRRQALPEHANIAR